MRRGKRRVLLIVLIGVLILIGLFVFFRKEIFADTLAIPSWVDSATVAKYNTWTTTQKAAFNHCIGIGIPTKSTLTSNEIAQFGSNSVAFNLRPTVDVTSTSPYWPWYQSSYRLIVTPLKYELQSDGTRKFQMKISLGNPSNAPVIVANPEARYYFWFANTTTPKMGNVIFTRGVDYTYTLLPGEYVSKDTLELTGINSPLYWGVDFYNMRYSLSAGTPNFVQPVWDPIAQKTDNTVSCIINPMPISDLVPTAIASPTVSAAPSVMPGSRPVTFHKGFNAFGNAGMVNGDMIKDAGMSIYQFDGPSNSWQIYPGGTVIDTDMKRGYYIFNPGADKTLRFGFGNPSISIYELKKGWNMLWTATDKNLGDLNFYYNSQNASAASMIKDGLINQNIFIIADDTATTACSYFKLLKSSESTGTCSGGVEGLGGLSKIPGMKSFWVYAN